MIRLDPEHGTRVDNIEAIVLCKVTHPGDGVSATLHLIKKQKRLRIEAIGDEDSAVILTMRSSRLFASPMSSTASGLSTKSIFRKLL